MTLPDGSYPSSDGGYYTMKGGVWEYHPPEEPPVDESADDSKDLEYEDDEWEDEEDDWDDEEEVGALAEVDTHLSYNRIVSAAETLLTIQLAALRSHLNMSRTYKDYENHASAVAQIIRLRAKCLRDLADKAEAEVAAILREFTGVRSDTESPVPDRPDADR
jgi:hypothetical protein